MSAKCENNGIQAEADALRLRDCQYGSTDADSRCDMFLVRHVPGAICKALGHTLIPNLNRNTKPFNSKLLHVPYTNDPLHVKNPHPLRSSVIH